MGFNRARNILTLCGTDFITTIRKTRPWPWIPTLCLAFPAPRVRVISKKPIVTRQRPCTRTCIRTIPKRWKNSSACRRPGTFLATRRRRVNSTGAKSMATATRSVSPEVILAGDRGLAGRHSGGNRVAAVRLKVRKAIHSKTYWAACSGAAGVGAARARKRDAIYDTGWKFRSRMPSRARVGA